MRKWLCVLMVLAGCAATVRGEAVAARGEGAAIEGQLSVTLEDAVVIRDPKKRRHRDRSDAYPLVVDMVCRGGEWEKRVWAYTPGLPGLEHEGELESVKVVDGGIEATVRLRISPLLRYDDRQYVFEGGFGGGEARYEIVIRRDGDGWQGSHAGSHETARVSEALAEAPLPRRDEEAVTHQPEWRKPMLERIQPVLKQEGEALEEGLFGIGMSVLKGAKLAGEVRGRVWPMASRAGDEKRPARGEHPRLLFTKADLPRLRELAKTEAGAAVMARLRELLARDEHGFRYHPPPAPAYSQAMWAAGYGLLYQLTGDDSQKEWSKQLVLSAMYTPHAYGNYYGPPMFVHGVALAYDLWYDAWDEDFRSVVRLYLERNARAITRLQLARDPLRMGDLQHFANPLPLDPRGAGIENWNAHLRAVAGLAALAIDGDPVPIRRPVSPGDAKPVPAADDYEPWVGVPVVPFTDNNMPGRWLINGPFYVKEDEDMLASLGGRAQARPRPGDAVESGGVKVAFRHFYPTGSGREPDPVNPKAVQIYPRADAIYWSYSDGFGGYLPATKIRHPGRGHRRVVYLYTVVRNERERVVVALPNWASHGPGARMWINSVEVEDGDLVKLEKGLYPLMVELDPGGGYATKSPRLREYTQHRYERDMADYTLASRRYVAAGETFPGVETSLDIAARTVRRYAVSFVGPNGWGRAAGHGNYNQALGSVVPFVVAYERLRGVNLAEGTGLEQLMPLVASMAGHERWALDGSLYDFNVLAGTALMGEEQRRLASWYAQERGRDMELAHQAVLLLDSVGLASQAMGPGEVMQRVGRHSRHGVTTWASDWAGEDRCFVQVNGGGALAESVHGSGHFLLRALGWTWTARGGESGRWTDRREANTLSVHNLFPTGPARVTHVAEHDDNSFTISLVTDTFKRGRIFEVNGREHWWVDESSQPAVRWTRAMAVDCSGLSGAGCVVAVVDKVVGAAGVHKRWRMQVGPDAEHLAVDGHTRGFVVSPPRLYRSREAYEGVLRGQVIWPGESVRIEKTPIPESRRAYVTIHHEKPATDPEDMLAKRLEQYLDQSHLAGRKVERDEVLEDLLAEFREAVKADEDRARNRAMAPTGFFVVMTIGEGNPPAIQVEGEGLGAKVRIGQRLLWFDGEKVVMGKVAEE